MENGWAGWFHDSQTNYASTGGEQAVGESIHYTQFPGASLYLQFEGTAIYLYGTANCSYDITLDSQSAPAPSSLPFNVLFYQEGLEATTHSVQLTAHPEAGTGQMVGFDRAMFTNTVNQDASGLIPVVYENWNDTIQYAPEPWQLLKGVDWIPNTSNPQPYVETNVSLSSASLNFTGGVAVAINAPRNWGHWTYNVTLDGQASSWNCGTLWGIGDAVLFYQNNLDPTKEHAIELLNTGMHSYYKLSLNDITVWHLNGSDLAATPSSSTTSGTSSASTGQPTQNADSTSSKKTNVGVIVGPVIASVVLLVILFVGGIWWWRRHRTASQSTEDPVAPFPRSDRPPVWSKGQEAGILPMTQVYEAVVPTTGDKRAMIQAAVAGPSGSAPPPVPVSAAPSTSRYPPTSPGGHPQQPSTSGLQSINPPSSGPTIDVNQIIELIAQRIDPRSNAPVGDAPPQYPVFPTQ